MSLPAVSSESAAAPAGVRMAFCRANLHDTTPSVQRGLDAAAGLYQECAVFCWNRPLDPVPDVENRSGLHIERFARTAPPRSLRMVLMTLRYQLWLIRRLVAFRPDLVQALDFESAWAARVACLITGARLIYDMRDPVALCYRLPFGIQKLIEWADRLLVSVSAAYVVPSEWLRGCLGKWGRSTRPVAVIRNTCFDWPEAREAAQRVPTDPLRIAFLGYLVDSRGAGTLLDLCRLRPGEVELLVAGQCRAQDLADELRSTPGVRMLGQLPRVEAYRLMKQSDAVALLYDPSVPVNVIATPNKFYEAMMTGTPVVLSEGMGLADEVRSRGIGLIVPYGDTAALAAALDRLRDPATREAYRRRCREYFLAECELGHEILKYRSFYETVLRRAA